MAKSYVRPRVENHDTARGRGNVTVATCNTGNIYKIMRSTENLKTLAKMDEASLKQLLGGIGGSQLFEFLNTPVDLQSFAGMKN